MSIPFPCGITLRETTNGGLDSLVGGMDREGGYTQFGRVHPAMEPALSFIIVLVKAPIGMKGSRIIMFLSGRNGITLFSLIRA